MGGARSLPVDWTGQVELRDVIETLSRDLVAITGGVGDEALVEKMADRYPGR